MWPKSSQALFLSIVLSIGCFYSAWADSAVSEIVYVKYRGPINLAPFECEWVSRSSIVKRLCYDANEQYAIVNLTGTYYHYCEVPPDVIAAWRQAESMGRYYGAQVKGRYDCRVLRVPPYTN
jgi:hypothetical protein